MGFSQEKDYRMGLPQKLSIAIPLAILCIVLLIFPYVFGRYVTHVLILVLLYGYLASSWNVLCGYTGQLSLGHAIFVGVGAYFPIVFDKYYALNPWLGMLMGAAFAAIVAFLIGSLVFHYGLKGPYFALSTIAFGQVFLFVVLNILKLGGAGGMSAPLRDSALINFQWVSKVPYYYILLIMTAGIVVMTYYLQKSRLGFFFVSIRENERLAQSLGIYPFKYKLVAFAISAFLTALGGSFYAQYLRYVDPRDVLGLNLSIEIALFGIVGGLGTATGPVIGSLLMVTLAELTRTYFGSAGAGAHVIVYGVILILIIIYAPKGLIGLLKGFSYNFLRTIVK